MDDVDYQKMADQINAAYGTCYEARHVKEIVSRLASTGEAAKTLAGGYQIVKKNVEFTEAVSLERGDIITITLRDLEMQKQPDRVYRINPKMTAVEMLHKAVFDAGYDIVAHRALLRKENPI